MGRHRQCIERNSGKVPSCPGFTVGSHCFASNIKKLLFEKIFIFHSYQKGIFSLLPSYTDFSFYMMRFIKSNFISRYHARSPSLSSLIHTLLQTVICSIVYRFQPLIRTVLTRNFNRQMRKPAIRCSAMPVFHSSRDIDYISRV